MANRHLSRSIVLQTLFEWDFNGNQNAVIPEIMNRDIEEFALQSEIGNNKINDLLF